MEFNEYNGQGMLTMLSSFNSGPGIRARKTTEASPCEQGQVRVFALILVACSVDAAFAQQPFGTIVETVTDTTGATLPAAKVTVTNTATQAKQIVTSATGNYSVPYLVNGVYTIRVEHPGFQTSNAISARARLAEPSFRSGSIPDLSSFKRAGL